MITSLKLELTIPEIDMMFILFQSSRQDKYSFDDINVLMRKIQEQGKPQLEAVAVKTETLEVRKPRKPRTPKVVVPATPPADETV